MVSTSFGQANNSHEWDHGASGLAERPSVFSDIRRIQEFEYLKGSTDHFNGVRLSRSFLFMHGTVWNLLDDRHIICCYSAEIKTRQCAFCNKLRKPVFFEKKYYSLLRRFSSFVVFLVIKASLVFK